MTFCVTFRFAFYIFFDDCALFVVLYADYHHLLSFARYKSVLCFHLPLWHHHPLSQYTKFHNYQPLNQAWRSLHHIHQLHNQSQLHNLHTQNHLHTQCQNHQTASSSQKQALYIRQSPVHTLYAVQINEEATTRAPLLLCLYCQSTRQPCT